MLEALVGAHEIELIRIFLTKSRQDGDLQIRYLNMINFARCNIKCMYNLVYEYVHRRILYVSFY